MVPAKKKAVVLGATGMMGQKFVQLLANHPWLEVSAVAARETSLTIWETYRLLRQPLGR